MGTPKSSIPASRTGAPARALVFQTMEESLRSKVCYGLMGKICLSAGGTGGEGFKWTHLWLQRMPCELNISVSSVLLVVLCTSLRSVSNKTQTVSGVLVPAVWMCPSPLLFPKDSVTHHRVPLELLGWEERREMIYRK